MRDANRARGQAPPLELADQLLDVERAERVEAPGAQDRLHVALEYVRIVPAKSKTIRGSRKDAERELRRILRSRDTGDYVEPSRMKLNAYLNDWLESAARPKVATRTYGATRLLVTVHWPADHVSARPPWDDFAFSPLCHVPDLPNLR